MFNALYLKLVPHHFSMKANSSFLISLAQSCLTLFILISVHSINAQQTPDTSYTFPIQQPAYPNGKGPEILIDAAHYNFHTREGGFSGFSRLMEQDGYEVKGLTKMISGADILKGCKILVIANALDSTNARNWVLPTPSAFSKEEIADSEGVGPKWRTGVADCGPHAICRCRN